MYFFPSQQVSLGQVPDISEPYAAIDELADPGKDLDVCAALGGQPVDLSNNRCQRSGWQ